MPSCESSEQVSMVGIGGGLVYDKSDNIFIHINKYGETTAFSKRIVEKIVTSIKYKKQKTSDKSKIISGYSIVFLDVNHKKLLQVDFKDKKEWVSATNTIMSSSINIFNKESNKLYFPHPINPFQPNIVPYYIPGPAFEPGSPQC